MATLREGQHLGRENTVQQALERAVDRLPSRLAERGLSAPDDSGYQGVFVDDGDGGIVYQRWFSIGDELDSRPLSP